MTGNNRAIGRLFMHINPGSFSVLVVALTAFLVFSGTLGHELVWDDEPVIRYTRLTVEEGGLGALVLAPFSTGVDGPDELTGYYRPVSLVSMWINSPAGEPSPFPYHLVNILLHVINSLLVFHLLTLIIPTGPGALLGGLIFAVHPVHAESVSFVSGRTDLLAALFILPVVILWYRSCGLKSARTRDYFVLAMIFFTLACLSKEIAFVLPAVIFFWTMIKGCPEDNTSGRGTWARSKWVLVSSIILCGVMLTRLLIVKIGTGPGWSKYAQLSEASLFSLLGDISVNVLEYIRLMVIPWPLSVFYPPVPPPLTWVTWMSVLLFTVMCFVFSGRRHHRIGVLSLVWTLLFLLPVSGIVGLGQSVIAERFCYLPSIGIVMIMGYAMGQLRPTTALKHIHTLLILILLGLFSTGSVLHAGRWKDNLTLFTNALNAGPVKVPTMYVSLGIAYKDSGQTELALEAFEEAVRMDPSFLRGLLNLGVTQKELGSLEKALKTFDSARVLDPLNPAVWYNRGVVLEELQRMDEAIEAYDRTARLDPGESAARYRKGKLLSRMGRYGESLEAYQEAVSVEGDHVGAHIGMGRSYERMGQVDQAIEMFMRAIELNPQEVISYGDLGRVLLATGRATEAVEVFRMATAIDPHDPVAGKGLIVAYFRAGEEEKARAYIEDLRTVDPELYDKLRDLMVSLSGKV